MDVFGFKRDIFRSVNDAFRSVALDILPDEPARPVPVRGAPGNVSPGGVHRATPVIVKANWRSHVRKDGVPVMQAGTRELPVMLHRGVPAEVFKDEKNAARRRAAGRFVGPFCCPKRKRCSA